MANVLKGAASAGAVAPFAGRPRSAGQPAAEDRLAAALAEIARLEDELVAAEAVRLRAEAAARADGRREGAAAAAAAENRRVEALEAGIAAASARAEESLAGVERLALLLARTALTKLVATDAPLAGLVGASIARQMEQLRREVVSVVRVSAEDFPDEAALAALAAAAGTGSVRLLADGDLGAGECRMDLLLGHVDLGVRSRWRDAAALLEEMAAEDAGT
ncbi:MAG TPA: hypothetical protein VGB08_10845 [Allosphingosinicella sp.]|jgi:flagellar biosynthesis/type III secretory pathway protein FliH